VQSKLREERHKSFLWKKNFVKTQHAENHGVRKASLHGKNRTLRKNFMKCSLSWVSDQAGPDSQLRD